MKKRVRREYIRKAAVEGARGRSKKPIILVRIEHIGRDGKKLSSESSRRSTDECLFLLFLF